MLQTHLDPIVLFRKKKYVINTDDITKTKPPGPQPNPIFAYAKT